MVAERPRALVHAVEDAAAVAVLALMCVLPVVTLVSREWLGGGVPGSIAVVQHMTLWISLLGAALAARSNRLLALSTGAFLPAAWRPVLGALTSLLAAAVTFLLAAASIGLVRVDLRYGGVVAWGVPVWAFTAVLPLGFLLITVRLVRHAGPTARHRVVAALGVAAGLAFVLVDLPADALVWPLAALLAVGTVLGMPIYAAIGGLALLLFWAEGTPVSAVPGEAYRMSTSPMLPAIPLFTLAGYILAAGRSSRRLLEVFEALIGWMPGGLAVVVTLLLAFFTPLTGASGITIVALGGLLLPMLLEGRYSERNALGLVTVSGSIGVLFPPSLPVILYAYYAELGLREMFLAGVLPGAILVVAVAAFAAWRGVAEGAVRTRFDARRLAAALWRAKWELLLPVVVLAGLFGGFATLVEASALTVLYALALQTVVFRELDWRGVVGAAVESATMVGGFMIILSVALGLTDYLIIAQVPAAVLDFVQRLVSSPYAFLLLLNALLIVVGALMDIYSAIIVIVPLVAPLAAAYGIHPVHLGIVFLTNMQLGYLMPPMGENLFLSAYRFERPLAELYRCVLPFVGIILAVVLLVTYVPGLALSFIAS
ncbi:MAG TPA: TRAP transporter large permease subunit [Gammaproteobacteria bacterium]